MTAKLLKSIEFFARTQKIFINFAKSPSGNSGYPEPPESPDNPDNPESPEPPSKNNQ